MKANLLDLKILDRHQQSDQFDLILYLPSEEDVRMTSKVLKNMTANIKILRDEISSNKNIHVITCETPDEGAYRMEKMLKAG
jgi:hypothetical protein